MYSRNFQKLFGEVEEFYIMVYYYFEELNNLELEFESLKNSKI